MLLLRVLNDNKNTNTTTPPPPSDINTRSPGEAPLLGDWSVGGVRLRVLARLGAGQVRNAGVSEGN